ncbi:MAG: hypothetical protein HOV79_16880 [Hamadaea sp.]|nr:hypothetical protein [Hamadaea sp.]
MTFAIGLIALAGAQFDSEPRAAWADTVVQINPGNVPTTADGFEDQECDPNQGGGPLPGQDIWVFNLPAHNQAGDFVSVTANFGPNGTVTITAADDPENFSNGGPAASKAWIITPDGWTLFGASAVITGEADFFVLTHTCPAASPSPSPSVSPSMSPSASPSVSPSMSPSASPSASPSKSPSASPSASPSKSPSRSPGYGYGGPEPSPSDMYVP